MSELDAFSDLLNTRIDADPAARPSSKLVPPKSLAIRIGVWFQPRVNRIVGRASKVGDRPVHDTGDFPWIALLEANWATIRDEAAAALTDLDAVPPLAAISPDHRRIAPAGRWKSYFLHGYGYRIEENCRRCPATAALIGRVPGLNSAFFSILLPRTHIPVHTGVTKAIMTCHLGVQVPRDAARCRMRVTDLVVGWEEGRALVFDDTYEHEVLNDTDEPRIILLIQFRRPARLWGRILGRLFLGGVRRSRFVQDARRGLAAWRPGD